MRKMELIAARTHAGHSLLHLWLEFSCCNCRRLFAIMTRCCTGSPNLMQREENRRENSGKNNSRGKRKEGLKFYFAKKEE